jgi:hypothetical protein
MAGPAATGYPWERYAANGNPAVTRQAVHAAVDRAFQPADAAVIKAHTGGHDRAILQAVQAQLPRDLYPSPVSAEDAGAQVGIRNPMAYQGSIDNNRAAVMAQHAAALAAGHPEAAAGLLDVMQAHDADPAANVAAKAAARDAALAPIKDAKHRAAAQRFFTKRIMHHGPRPVKG